MARIMGLRRRIYFSSIRALHIGRTAGSVGGEEKDVRVFYIAYVIRLVHESSRCDENRRPAPKTMMLHPSRARVKFLYVLTGRN